MKVNGQTYLEHIFLNPYNNFKNPGKYSIDAKYLDGLRNKKVRATPIGITAATTLHLTIDPNAPPVGSEVFQTWVDRLRSTQWQQRLEAAWILSYLAPPAFEDTLLRYTRDYDFRGYAPRAFYRLNTPQSIAALAALMEGPLTNEQIEAAGYLADTKDQKWLPLLLRAAQEHAGISSFPSAAARLGGEDTIPMLVSLEKNSSQEAARINAVTALSDTGSRAAVPILLEYLKSPETDIAGRGRYGLETLTHRTARVGPSIKPTQKEYALWSQWWEHYGKTAPIYPATQFCTKRVPLPQTPPAHENKNKASSAVRTSTP